MKKLSIAFSVLLVTCLACKKGKQAPPNTSTSLIGKWDLVLVTGGIAGIHETAAQWGHKKSYTFHPDSSCISVFDLNTKNNIYSLKDTSYYNNGLKTYLTIGSNEPREIDFAHDTLTLYDGAFSSEPVTEWYVKE